MNKKIIVMGVSGCGKSTIGEMLAEKLDCSFHDGDDYHPLENVEKMQNGTPLTDEDRQSWLETLNELITKNDSLVLACSALKPAYRAILSNNNHGLKFVYLKADFETIWNRHKAREGHYFNGKEMLESQFDALVEPSECDAIYIDITHTPVQIIESVVEQLNAEAD